MRVLAAAVYAALSLFGGGGDGDIHGVARFRELRVSFFETGHAPTVSAWRTRILLARRQRTIGTAIYTCIQVDLNTSVNGCTATFTLPEGSIVAQGEIRSKSAFQMLIVGGTGVYAGGDGTLVVRRFSLVPWQTALTFYFV